MPSATTNPNLTLTPVPAGNIAMFWRGRKVGELTPGNYRTGAPGWQVVGDQERQLLPTAERRAAAFVRAKVEWF